MKAMVVMALVAVLASTPACAIFDTSTEIETRTSGGLSKKPGGISAAQLARLLKLVEEAVNTGALKDDAKKEIESFACLSGKDFEKVAQKIKAWKTYEPHGQEDFTIQSAGMQTYVHLPTKYDPKKSYPLIIALHGAGGTGASLRGAWVNNRTEWGAKARSDYIVVAPTWPDARWRGKR